MNAPSDPQLDSLRIPPHSIEAEQSVIGGLLRDNAACDRIADFMHAEDFYRYDHRIIFEQIVKLINASKPADVITVFETLTQLGKADDVGGLHYLNAMAQNTPSAANIRRYAEIVRDRGVLRKLITVADEISGKAFNPQGKEVKQMLDEAESKIFAIAEARRARRRRAGPPIQPLLTQVVERIDELYSRDNQSEITGVPTGFIDLDRMTSGLQPGDLVIVAGRPSMGKTAFSVNIGENVAIEAGLPVAVFSMEMGGAQLAMRMLGSVGQLDQHRLRTGRLNDEDWPRLTHAIQKMNDAQLYIDETPALNSDRIARPLAPPVAPVRQARPDHRRLPAADVGQQPGDNRATEISEISRGLKGLAKELQLPRDRAVPAEPLAGTTPEQASRHVRLARIGRYRAGCRRDHVHVPRRGLQPRLARQGNGRDHHRQAA